jgi:hypothetical protein
MKKVDPLQFWESQNLGGKIFPDQKSWFAPKVLVKGSFGLSLTRKELTLWHKCTDERKAPKGPFRVIVVIAGRRSGKSRLGGQIITPYLALFFDYRKYLAPGERGVIVIIAADRQQARVIFNYISGALHSSKTLEQYILNETKERIELTNGIDIEIATCNYRTIRGRTIVAALCDETAFWQVDGANPDFEIINALLPSMATIPNSMLWIFTTPHARKGVCWQYHKDFFGVDDPEHLVWHADTRTMNPTISEAFIKRELEKDEAVAKAEWLAQFRSDIESYITREMVDQVVVSGRFELPPISGVSYGAFTDPAGGSGKDSMTLAVSHIEPRSGLKVLDLTRKVRPPFSPDQAVREFVRVLQRYRVNVVVGDRYAGEWPRERFLKLGVKYRVADKTKSELYQEFLPLITSKQCELLDNPRLVNQLCSLERRTGRSGKDTIDHPPRSHDDLANCVAGALAGINVRRAGTFRPQRSRRRLNIAAMFPGAVRGSIRTWDSDKGEIVKIK